MGVNHGHRGYRHRALGAYWDVAWHLDRGRETFWSAPHLLIYGAIAAVLLAVATGVLSLPRGQRWQAILRHPGLRFTVVATTLALASAPFDEVWHLTFGLDASIWSPPHLVLLFGFALSVFGIAVLAQDQVRTNGWLQRIPGVVLFGAAIAVMLIFVNEFEWQLTDNWNVLAARPLGLYPFWYSVLTCMVLAAGARAIGKPGSAAAIAAVGWALRLLVSVAWLPALGHSRPYLPPFLLAMGVAIDLSVAWFGKKGESVLPHAAGSALASLAAFLLHAPTAVLISVRAVDWATLLSWGPLAAAIAMATGYIGYRLAGMVHSGHVIRE